MNKEANKENLKKDKNSSSDFNSGCKYARDNILSTIIGLQNNIGPNNPKYDAYQEIYDVIVNKYGDMFTGYKA